MFQETTLVIGFLIFALCSGFNIVFSWRWLDNPRQHGFYRFFAFEGLCGLIVVQAGKWFADPFSLRQLFSWVVLASSLAVAVHCFWILSVHGRPRGDFEQTTVLVTKGAYHYVRHPMYGSLLLLTCGALLKSFFLLSAGLAAATALFLVLTALVEEKENLARFGPSYAAYRKQTRMFIPWLF